jgi:DNA polymerase III epsilon subunit-like protein
MTLPRIILGDTETTGLPPDGWKYVPGRPFPPSYRCCEIAWIELDDHLNVIDSHESLIDPQAPIPEGASAIHGITDRDVWTAPTLAEYKEAYADKLQGDIILIAHKADFDRPFFEEVFNVTGDFCTLALSRYALPTIKNHKLQTLREVLKVVSSGQAHRAMGDLDVLRACLMKLIPGARNGIRPYLNTPVRMLSVMPLGEHKGKPITMVPRAYREYMLREHHDMHPDMRYTLEQLRDI